jgi:cell division protein FtsB
LVRIKENEDQIQYLKKKNRILEGNIEFLLDNNAINELKIIKLTKQMKKLQKEVNEYD